MRWPEDFSNKILCGNCLDLMRDIPDRSIDLIATDSPYGLFMANEKWDATLPAVEIWRECFRVLKSGAFMFAMSSPRQDLVARMILNIQEAGFEMDNTMLSWVYLSGFPKSLDVSLAIDRRLGEERKESGSIPQPGDRLKTWSRDGKGREMGSAWTGKTYDKNPITPEAKIFDGWRSPGLKPAFEPILVAQKAMDEKDFAGQALRSIIDPEVAPGGFNIDACRIPYQSKDDFERIAKNNAAPMHRSGNRPFFGQAEKGKGDWRPINPEGRYPSNLLISGGALDGGHPTKAGGSRSPESGARGRRIVAGSEHQSYGDEGSPGRAFDIDAWWARAVESLPADVRSTFPFLIDPKPSPGEKDAGCENLFWERDQSEFGFKAVDRARWEELGQEEKRITTETGDPVSLRLRGNIHLSVKPVNLFCYLLTLASRRGDVVLDPFAGSGTTGVAAKIVDRKSILMDLHEGNCEIARRRVRSSGLPLFEGKEGS